MSNKQSLLNCTFGWGKTCRLYYDSIEIAGKSYSLKDLTSIHPSYRSVFGVPSARLEISFGLDHLVLRGIADLDVARLMVSHLQPYCSTAPHLARIRTRSSRARHLARAQAKAWERTNKLPAIPISPDPVDALKPIEDGEDDTSFKEAIPTDEPLLLDAVPKAPVEDTSLTPSETLEAFAQLANNLSTYTSPLPAEVEQPPHTPRFHPPLHSVHLIHPEQKFDSASMPVPVVKSSVLPIIHVPVRLLHGECAHYSIGATLCSDRIASSNRATYPSLDNGLLVLTNRRVLYIGKRCQFTLAYTHLWYVSLLHTAIALHIEGQFRRIIIELEHPHEWASRVELLSFIARRARPREEPPTLTVATVPGLNTTTVKRRAIKTNKAKKSSIADNATVQLLPEGVRSKIVDAETIEISDTTNVDVSADPENAATRAVLRPSDITHLPTQEFSLTTQLEDVCAQASPQQADITHLPTQEFSLAGISTAPDEARAQVSSRQADITHLPTQEFSLADLNVNRTEALEETSEGERKTQSQPLDDDDDRTICLHDRKMSVIRTISLREPISGRLSDSEIKKRRPQRIRTPQRHA